MKFSFASKARENIQAAELLLENKWYNASVNRSYYAAFHAALAVLASVDALEEKIKHGNLQAKFNKELIQKRKIFSAAFKSHLKILQEVRDIADYSDQSISKKRAVRQYKRAEEFVKTLIQEISDD